MYKIQSHPMDDYIAGKDAHEHQILIGLRYPYLVAMIFDDQGRLLEARVRPLRFRAPSVYETGPFIIEDPVFRERVSKEMSAWQTEIGFHEEPVLLQQFAITELSLGIEDLPRHLRDFNRDPTEFSEEEQREFPGIIAAWASEGNYILWWGTDYYLDKEGTII